MRQKRWNVWIQIMEMRSEDVPSYFVCEGEYVNRFCIDLCHACDICAIFYPSAKTKSSKQGHSCFSRVVFCDECNCVSFLSLACIFLLLLTARKRMTEPKIDFQGEKKRGRGGK